MLEMKFLSDKMILLPVKSDFVFKLIFGDQKNIDILASFLKSVLDIPDEENTNILLLLTLILKRSRRRTNTEFLTLKFTRRIRMLFT